MLIPSGRVMLSANVIGNAKAHHQIRHRARHGLRGGVATPLQRFALVVPCRRPPVCVRTRTGRRRPPVLSRRPCGTCTAPIPISCRIGSAGWPCPAIASGDGGLPGRSVGLHGVEHPACKAGKFDLLPVKKSSLYLFSLSCAAFRRLKYRVRKIRGGTFQFSIRPDAWKLKWLFRVTMR